MVCRRLVALAWQDKNLLFPQLRLNTGVPRSYEPPPPVEPYSSLMPRIYGDPMGVGVSYERGTPVLYKSAAARETLRERPQLE